MVSKNAALGVLLAPVIMLPVWAHAQSTAATSTPPEPVANAAPGLDEIVVTARRRAESLSDVPISISAISADQLNARSMQNENDLQSAVPGLLIRQNGNANQFNYAIRGQTIDTYSNSPPGVLPYIDDVQIVSHSATAFYDLENIQVLKGPQGTLFGRNTTGGAVLYETAKPKDEFSGYVQASYGNFDTRKIEAAATLPLTSGLSLRIAGLYLGGGAYVRNFDTGENLGDQGQKSVRATLLFNGIERLTNTTVGQYTRDDGTNTPGEAYSAYTPGSTFNGKPLYSAAGALYGPGFPAFDAFVAAHPNIYQAGVLAFTARERLLGPWIADVNVPLTHTARNAFGINTTTYDISPTLTIKNILGYNNSDSKDGDDYDGTPYSIFQSGGTPTADAQSLNNPQPFEQSTEQLSDELQLQGKAFNSTLDYVLGFYFLNEQDLETSHLYAFDFSPIAPGLPLIYASRSDDRSTAVFAQATYKLTDQLNFTAGGRYTDEKISFAQDSFSTLYNPALTRQENSVSKPSWTASLDYKITPSLLAYATTRGSWRAGGYNFTVFPLNADASGGGNRFEPETTKDVEVGLKYSGSELGAPMTFNADVFNQWVSNVQRAAYTPGPGGTPTLLTANVPKAEVTGVEADFTIRPLPWFLLGLSGTYTDARYTDGNLTILGTAFSYGPYADAPKVTGSLYTEVSQALPNDAGTLKLRADVFAQSDFYFSNVANTLAPGTQIAGYSLTNIRLTWANLMGTKLNVALYARNIFDKPYYTGGNATGPNLGLNVADPGQPRMFGGEVRYSF